MAKDGKATDQRAREDEAQERAARGQSLALGDTGDRQTGVDSDQQGISNRSGDRPDEDAETGGEGGQRSAATRGDDDEASPPVTEAGVPPEQNYPHTSLDSPSQTGRPRADRGGEPIERTGRQETPRSDPDALRPLGSPSPDDNTM